MHGSGEKMNDLNRLKMNFVKTEFILVDSTQQLGKTKIDHINVNGILIKKLSCIKYLVALTDSNLTFKQHITSKCKTATWNMLRLNYIRECLTEDPAIVLALGMVMSHLDYANAVLANLPDIEIRKMQRVQLMTAKPVLQRNKHDSKTVCLRELHWLPVHARIEHKIFTLIHKCISENAPEYLKSLIAEFKAGRSGLSSQYKVHNLVIPFTKCKPFADRALSVVGPSYGIDCIY